MQGNQHTNVTMPQIYHLPFYNHVSLTIEFMYGVIGNVHVHV